MIERMWSNMVVPTIRKLFDSTVKLLFCFIAMQINQITFERVEISFHRSVVIRAVSSAHALSNTVTFAEKQRILSMRTGNLGHCAGSVDLCECAGLSALFAMF